MKEQHSNLINYQKQLLLCHLQPHLEFKEEIVRNGTLWCEILVAGSFSVIVVICKYLLQRPFFKQYKISLSLEVQ